MELTSSAFVDNGYIPKDYTAEGINMNPPLSFREVPEEAHSLALIVTDPDAPSGNFVHWLIWNIPPLTTEIGEGVVPFEAVEGKNDFGTFMWGGPNPPSGVHRYEFRLYALDTLINLPQTSNKDDLLSHISGLILEEALLTGLYEREAHP
jgi:Raf kinase inhibitor-like YbhB/YbcL family protein